MRSAVRSVMAAQVVEKGNVRNTVLRQVKNLKRSVHLLEQGKEIKEQEIPEHKDKHPAKAKELEKQVGILTTGIGHLQRAISELEKYKETSTSRAV